MLVGVIADIAGVTAELQLVRLSEIGNKLLILVGLGQSQLVIEMGDGEDDSQLAAQFEQKSKQGNGICSAGNRNGNAVSGMNQGLAANVAQDSLRHVGHATSYVESTAATVERRLRDDA